MTELMLRDAGSAHGLRHVIWRYFNAAGADPLGRIGQSTKGAIHLIKVSVETALGLRPRVDVFGTDYPTPDGTCIRDYIHVSDLVRAHCDALAYLRGGGQSVTLNCGYGRGFSVLEVIDKSGSPASTLRSRSSGGGPVIPRRSWRLPTVPVLCSNGFRISTTYKPSCATRWRGSASF
jgi:UDP-glucose 4-epimerase